VRGLRARELCLHQSLVIVSAEEVKEVQEEDEEVGLGWRVWRHTQNWAAPSTPVYLPSFGSVPKSTLLALRDSSFTPSAGPSSGSVS
jgi:hypothetical protein